MDIHIHTEFVTMAQFLKLANLIGSGGEAKFFLAQNTITVNGALEQRRGRKLYPGDTVLVGEANYQIKVE